MPHSSLTLLNVIKQPGAEKLVFEIVAQAEYKSDAYHHGVDSA